MSNVLLQRLISVGFRPEAADRALKVIYEKAHRTGLSASDVLDRWLLAAVLYKKGIS